jgi:hypothetical protein
MSWSQAQLDARPIAEAHARRLGAIAYATPPEVSPPEWFREAVYAAGVEPRTGVVDFYLREGDVLAVMVATLAGEVRSVSATGRTAAECARNLVKALG